MQTVFLTSTQTNNQLAFTAMESNRLAQENYNLRAAECVENATAYVQRQNSHSVKREKFSMRSVKATTETISIDEDAEVKHESPQPHQS